MSELISGNIETSALISQSRSCLTHKKHRLGLGYCLNTLKRWQARIEQRRELSQLSDELLKDIGLSEEARQRELNKPFWKA